MITVAEAKARMGRIRSPIGLARSNYPEDFKGQVARNLWHDPKFAYGMEYGYLLAMHDLVDGRDSTAALEDSE